MSILDTVSDPLLASMKQTAYLLAIAVLWPGVFVVGIYPSHWTSSPSMYVANEVTDSSSP